jgi:acyl carrier protein
MTDDVAVAGLPLRPFYLSLKQNGFLITPGQMVDANRVIKQFAAEARNEEELCHFLSPVFARNQEEQQQFEEIFFTHFKPKSIVDAAVEKKPDEPQGPWQKRWWKYLLLAAVLLMAGVLIYKKNSPPSKPLLPDFFLSDLNDAIKQRDGKLPFQVEVNEPLVVDVPTTTVSDTAYHAFTLKKKYNWGDGTAPTTDSVHRYTKAGLYTLTAFADVYLANELLQTDTLSELVRVCGEANRMAVVSSNGSDSAEVGKKIRLEAQITGWAPDSILWMSGKQRLGYGKTLDTIFNGPGFQSFFCFAIYGNVVSPCTLGTSFNLTVYDHTNFNVAITKASDAKPLRFSNKVKPYLFYLTGGLSLFFFFLPVYWLMKENRRKRMQKNKEEHNQQFTDWLRSFSGKKKPVPLPFRDKNYLSVPEPEIKIAAMQMRRRINADAVYLDVDKTINTAIRNNGFFDPVYIARLQESEYLVLIDASHNNNQQVKLFDFLIDTLRKQNINIDKWYYRYEPSHCFIALEPNGVSLEKLSEKFPHHIVLIFGNAYQLLQPYYPVINHDYLHILHRWKYKAILTPVSFPDWSNKEWTALLPHLPVTPVDVEGQLLLMEALFTNEFDIATALKQYRNNFYSSASLDFESTEDLEAYCHRASWAGVDEDDKSANILFQWTAALAVYPKVNWELTLAIGKAILDRYGKPEQLNFSNLLRLARIGWMKDGQFPDFTRLDLLKKLKAENEVLARETVLAMLKEIPDGELNTGHLAFEEKEVQRVTNEFLLYAFDPVKYAPFQRSKDFFERLWKGNKVRDAASRVYLKNEKAEWPTLVTRHDEQGMGSARPLPLDDYFEPDKKEDEGIRHRTRNLIRISVALLCLSVLALVGLIIIQLTENDRFSAFTYRPPKMVQVSFVQSMNSPGGIFSLKIDSVQQVLGSNAPSAFSLQLSDSQKTVSVFSDDGQNIYQTAMLLSADKYVISILRATQNVQVALQLPPQCVSYAANKFRELIQQSIQHVNITLSVTKNIDPELRVECLNSVAFGTGIRSEQIENLVAKFKNQGVQLSVSTTPDSLPAANEIRLFYTAVPKPAKSLIYIQYSNRRTLGQVQQLQRTLNAGTFLAPGVEYQPVSRSFTRNEIRYFNPAFADSLKLLQAAIRKVYPAKSFTPVLAQRRKGLASAEIWIYENIIDTSLIRKPTLQTGKLSTTRPSPRSKMPVSVQQNSYPATDTADYVKPRKLSRTDVLNTVKKIIVDKLGVSQKEVALSSRLLLDLGADDLDMVELTMVIEKQFGISIADKEVESFRTVEDIYNYVVKRLGL